MICRLMSLQIELKKLSIINDYLNYLYEKINESCIGIYNII